MPVMWQILQEILSIGESPEDSFWRQAVCLPHLRQGLQPGGHPANSHENTQRKQAACVQGVRGVLCDGLCAGLTSAVEAQRGNTAVPLLILLEGLSNKTGALQARDHP